MDKSEKMLHTLMGLEIGGAETHVVELVKELKRQGYNIIVASNGGVYEKELKEAGIKHYKVPLNERNPINFIKSYFLLKNIITKENIKLVHAHARIPGFICGLLQRKLKFTFVTTAHWVFFTGMGLKYITNWGQKVIAVSEDIKKYLIDNYHTKEENIFVTINGIDTEKFSPDIKAPEIKKEFNIKDETVIVYVSRMDTDRAQAAWELIDCTNKLVKKIEKLKIIIIGNGNEYNAMLKKVKAVNRKLGKEIIYMAGARTDINKIIAVADLFIGVSRAVLEAMAVAKPVIITGNEGYIGVFDDDKLENAIENNFTCRGNELSSKEKILKDIFYILSLSDKEKQELGRKGREVILTNYSVSKMAQDCLRAYDAALNNIEFNNMNKEVLVLGYYGFGNWGDEATLSAIINMIKQTSSKTKISVLSYNGYETYKTHGVNGISRNHYRHILKTIKSCDIVICGGGTILQDVTSNRSIYYYLAVVWLAKKYNKKIVFFSNGFGPIIKNKTITSKVCNQADDIIVRDEKSKSMMREMGINKKIYVSTDVVFNFYKNNNVIKENKIAVSLRPWKYSKQYTKDFVKQIGEAINILIDKGYNIDLISLKNRDDVKVLNFLLNKINKKEYVCLYTGEDFKQVMDRISESKIMIGMRLHANIFALINNIPVITINYDPKIEALSHDFEQPIIYIDDNDVCQEILTAVKNIEQSYNEKVDFIKYRTKQKRELLKINYNYLNKNL